MDFYVSIVEEMCEYLVIFPLVFRLFISVVLLISSLCFIRFLFRSLDLEPPAHQPKGRNRKDKDKKKIDFLNK